MKMMLLILVMLTLQNMAKADIGQPVQAYGNDHSNMVYDSVENCVAVNMGILGSYEDAVLECKNISPVKIKAHCIYNCTK